MRRTIPRLEGCLRGLWRLFPGGVDRDESRPRSHVRWLRERLFRCEDAGAPRVDTWRGRPVTERLTGSTEGVGVPLDTWLDRPATANQERRMLMSECGAELGRLHALGVVHGALTPAALRVFPLPARGGPGHGRRVSFASIGAGGPAAWLRGRGVTRAGELDSLITELSPHLHDGDEGVLRRAYANARQASDQLQ